MTNEELLNYSKTQNTEIAKILGKYYKNDSYLLTDLREIASLLIEGNLSYDAYEDLDIKLAELGSPWGDCYYAIRPRSYDMVVSFRQYINKVLVKMEQSIYA